MHKEVKIVEIREEIWVQHLQMHGGKLLMDNIERMITIKWLTQLILRLERRETIIQSAVQKLKERML